MLKKLKRLFIAFPAEEAGQALVIVLVMLVLGSLTLVPVLDHASTTLKSGVQYENKTDQYYSADAGIEEGLWRIKYSYWADELHHATYSTYDFNTVYSYQTEQFNGGTANVTIQNIWIPSNVNLTDLGISPAQAGAIINSDRLVVSGTAGVTPGEPYRIKIDFTPAAKIDPLASDNLTVKSIGVWLPQGFSYVEGSCTLDQPEHDGQPYYSVPTVTPQGGGYAVVWSYNPFYPLFTSFPDFVSENGTMSTTITFNYTPPAEHPDYMPGAIAWITTATNLDAQGHTANDVPISWDTDTLIYKITSSSGGTQIEAYSPKSELRKMGDAAAGDYVAVGNSMLTDDNGDAKRETWHTPNDAVVSSIPTDGDVLAAYLYWSGWRSDTTVFSDSCQNLNNWTNGGAWSVSSSNYFRSHSTTGPDDAARVLTLTSGKNLSPYAPNGPVMISWDEWVSSGSAAPGTGDGLDFAFYGSSWSGYVQDFRGNIGGSSSNPVHKSYTIPGDIFSSQYLTGGFKIKFKLVGFSGTNQYCYIDNIAITARPPDTSVVFKINGQQVYLDAQGLPQVGASPVTASESGIIVNTRGYSYACHRDVSELVKKYPVIPGESHHTGNATYTVGDVAGDTNDYLSYVGWSLIIVYTSPESAGHYLYLRDAFDFTPGNGGEGPYGTLLDLDFDGNGQPGGDISDFIIPEPIRDKNGVIIDDVCARLTCFVGEGDTDLSGDFVALNAPAQYQSDPQNMPVTYKLWDGTNTAAPYHEHGYQNGKPNNETQPDNVWNGQSINMTFQGVDIDTFEVTWERELLKPGDTTAHLDLYTAQDAWNLIYLIISVRSKTTTGGTDHYVIHGN
jgi:hypothetical protein